MKYTVIDVREPEEFQNGNVTGALNIPLNKLINGAKQLDILPKNSSIIVYCRSGSRSNMAMNILINLGFTNVTNGINKEQVEANFDLR